MEIEEIRRNSEVPSPLSPGFSTAVRESPSGGGDLQAELWSAIPEATPTGKFDNRSQSPSLSIEHESNDSGFGSPTTSGQTTDDRTEQLELPTQTPDMPRSKLSLAVPAGLRDLISDSTVASTRDEKCSSTPVAAAMMPARTSTPSATVFTMVAATAKYSFEVSPLHHCKDIV